MQDSVRARLRPWASWFVAALALLSVPATTSQNVCPQLRAPQNEPLGQVCVSYASGVLTVEYRAADGWALLETHLAVASSLDGLPLSENRAPKIGMFAYGEVLSGGARTARYSIPLQEVGGQPGAALVIAAHASLYSESGGEQGVWAEGQRFMPQGLRATYFTYTVPRNDGESDGAGDGDGPPETVAQGASTDAARPTAAANAIRARSGATERITLIAPDTLRGGPERDVFVGRDMPDLIEGSGGSDWLTGGAGDDVLRGDEDDDILEGGAGTDVLEGGPGEDILNGGSERDWLFGGDGNDLIRGGEGDDVAEGGSGLGDDLRDEDATGGDDLMFGDEGDDNFDGSAGDDILFGGEGEDILDGGDGQDQLHGGLGNDDLDGGDENDALYGDDGDDSAEGADGDDTLDGGRGRDLLNGGDGNDQISGGDDGDALLGGDGNDVIKGGGGEDLIGGGDGDDVVIGEAGQDTILGQGGRDHVSGGADADVLRGGADADVLEGGPGDDLLQPGTGPDVVRADEGNDTILIRAGDVDAGESESVDGGAGRNLLVLHGFSDAEVSVTRRPAAREPGDTVAAAASDLDAAIDDPRTGGSYRVNRVTDILYQQRLPAGGAGQAGEVLLLNGSASATTRLRLRRFGPGGDSLPIDSAGEPAADSVLPAYAARALRLPADSGGTVDLTADRPLGGRTSLAVPGVGGGTIVQPDLADALAIPIRIDRSQGGDDGLVVLNGVVGGPIKLTLVNDAGTEVESTEVELSAHASVAAPLARFFPRIRQLTGTLLVEGEEIMSAGVHTPDARRSVALPAFPTFPTTPRLDRRTVFFPHLSAGGADRTVLILYNPARADSAARGVVRFSEASGQAATVDLGARGRSAAVPFEVAAAGVMFLEIRGGAQSVALQARIEVAAGQVDAALEQWPANEAAFAYGAAPVLERFTAAARRRPSDGVGTLVALQSTGDAARVELVLRDGAGQEMRGGRATLELAAGGGAVRRLEQLFPNADTEDFLGSLTGSSSAPVAVAALQVGGEETAAGPLPVVRLR